MSVKRICECIVRNERSILPVSAMMHGEYGIEDITLSMAAIVGIGGVETHVPIALSEEEAEKLVESAKKLKEVAKADRMMPDGLPYIGTAAHLNQIGFTIKFFSIGNVT